MLPTIENIMKGVIPFPITANLKFIIIMILKYKTDPLCNKYPILPSAVNMFISSSKKTATNDITP